jgi:indole-3-glycerol phosphate synthase
MNDREPDFLARMASESQRRLTTALASVSERELRRRVQTMAPPPALRLSTRGFDVIAEIKRRSPSAGALASAELSVTAQARAYVAGGACALSVLTEPEQFAGHLPHLTAVAGALPQIPVMRKDFLVGPYQILEARAAGAAGVLLIAAMLQPEQLETMLAHAKELGLFALVEVFDDGDIGACGAVLEGAAAEGQVLLGVNCRNLRTLSLDFARFAQLAPALPGQLSWVAESGIESSAQAAEVARLGYRAALVGSALMCSSAPGATVRDLLAAGREAKR